MVSPLLGIKGGGRAGTVGLLLKRGRRCPRREECVERKASKREGKGEGDVHGIGEKKVASRKGPSI